MRKVIRGNNNCTDTRENNIEWDYSEGADYARNPDRLQGSLTASNDVLQQMIVIYFQSVRISSSQRYDSITKILLPAIHNYHYAIISSIMLTFKRLFYKIRPFFILKSDLFNESMR